MEQDKKDLKEYWEIRSKSFPGYNADDAYQISVLDTVKAHCVVFAGKSVLDVGCGSGAYALRMAKEAAHVTALDISSGMLEKLAESAKENRITNIECVESDWGNFSSDKKYDVIFCSLTPALGTKEDIAKLKIYANKWVIYITSKRSMRNATFSELLAMHGQTHIPTIFKPFMFEWLEENEVAFAMYPIKGEKVTVHTKDDITESCISVLDALKIKPDMAKVEAFIAKRKNSDGLYETKTTYDVEMYIWSNE